MVIFGFKEYQTELPNWSKYHKTIGVHVKRVDKDGREILTKDEKLKMLAVEHRDLLKMKPVTLRDLQTFGAIDATDFYLPLHNLDYQETNTNYSLTGVVNTKQTIRICAIFLIKDNRFLLDCSYKSERGFAPSFVFNTNRRNNRYRNRKT